MGVLPFNLWYGGFNIHVTMNTNIGDHIHLHNVNVTMNILILVFIFIFILNQVHTSAAGAELQAARQHERVSVQGLRVCDFGSL